MPDYWPILLAVGLIALLALYLVLSDLNAPHR
jgi:hypothetical protein